MRCRVYLLSGVLLGTLTLGGCGQPGGAMIPPSQGGEQARFDMEHPFGAPKNLKKFRPRKAANTKGEDFKPVH